MDSPLQKVYRDSVKKNVNSERIQAWQTRQESLLNYIQKYIPPRSKILELGSGRGFLVKELTSKGFNITGSDFNPINIELAKK